MTVVDLEDTGDIMDKSRRTFLWGVPPAAIAMAFGPLADGVGAEEPVKLVIPFPAGGVTDAIGRKVADGLRELWGNPIVAENRGGASGNIAAAYAKGAPADGRTLFFGYAGTHAANASLFKSLPYDPVGDFTPIGLIADTPLLIVVNGAAPYKDLRALMAYAKANPGKLNFGSQGNGVPSHLALELFKMRAGISITHIPYKGLAQLLPDLVEGRIDGYFAAPLGMTEHIKSGKVRALALTAEARLPGLEAVPTTGEAGLPDFVYSSWFGLLASGRIPAARSEAMSKDLQTVVRSADFKVWCQQRFLRPLPSTGSEFAEFMAQQTRLLREVIATAKVTVD